MVMLLQFEPTLYLQNECVSLHSVSWQAREDLNKWDICKWIGIPAFSADCSGSTSENSGTGGYLWFYVASMGEKPRYWTEAWVKEYEFMIPLPENSEDSENSGEKKALTR